MSVSLESPNFLVLLALADGDKYASEIQRQIVGDTGGVYVPDMTIRNALKAMQKVGLIESRQEGWRIVYEITDEGKRRLEIEAKTRKESVRHAQERLGYR